MDTFYYLGLPFLLMYAVIGVAIFVYIGGKKTAPAWLQRTAFRIRLVVKTFFYIGKWLLLAGLSIYLVVGGLAWIGQDGAIWLWPESKFGYANKYEVREEEVYVQAKPHDCEWGKAPIGNKYCHFEKTISTEKNSQGKVTAVYVNWERKDD